MPDKDTGRTHRGASAPPIDRSTGQGSTTAGRGDRAPTMEGNWHHLAPDHPEVQADPVPHNAPTSPDTGSRADRDYEADQREYGTHSPGSVDADGRTANGYQVQELTLEADAQLTALANSPNSGITKQADGTYQLDQPITVEFTRTNPHHSAAEFDRQLDLQQRGLNALSLTSGSTTVSSTEIARNRMAGTAGS